MEAVAKKITLRFPDDGTAWKALGSALLEQRAVAESIEPLRLAARLLPADAVNANNLGNALASLREFREAETAYRRALALQPNFPFAHSNLLFNMNYSAEQSAATCLAEARRYGEMVSHAAKQFDVERRNPVELATKQFVAVGVQSSKISQQLQRPAVIHFRERQSVACGFVIKNSHGAAIGITIDAIDLPA